MVTESENQWFLLKINSVGPKLHQISSKKICRVYNTYDIVFQCYINLFELCSCNRQRNVLAIFVTDCHNEFQTPRTAISANWMSVAAEAELSLLTNLESRAGISIVWSGPSGPSSTWTLMSLSYTHSYFVHCISTTPYRNEHSIGAQ